jgi:hypothetical protein
VNRRFTILLPTFDHGPTIGYPVRCALRQTHADFELFIIGDGVSGEGRDLIHQLVRQDERVKFLDLPKHESRGETYRHQVLSEQATGDLVCYLCDRDLWFDDHLEQLALLLDRADWAHTLSMHVLDEADQMKFWPTDLGMPVFRQMILKGRNRAPLSSVGHTMALYRRLPHGWRTTPQGQPTDTYMWQQMLGEPGVAASGFRVTALTFPSPRRRGWTAQRRVDELERWNRRLRDDPQALRLHITEQAYAHASVQFGEACEQRDKHALNRQTTAEQRDAQVAALQQREQVLRRQLDDIHQSCFWKLRRAMSAIPGLGLGR